MQVTSIRCENCDATGNITREFATIGHRGVELHESNHTCSVCNGNCKITIDPIEWLLSEGFVQQLNIWSRCDENLKYIAIIELEDGSYYYRTSAGQGVNYTRFEKPFASFADLYAYLVRE